MNIFGLNINFSNKAQTRPEEANIKQVIKVPQQLFRITTDLTKYRNAVQTAENIINPYRYPLYQLYQQTLMDSHVTACIEQRMNLILGSEFNVYKGDKEDEEKSKLLQTKWFRDFIKNSLMSEYWGFSLVQFDEIIKFNGIEQFKEVELIPRQYVRPEFNLVVPNPASKEGQSYLDEPFSSWCIGVGEKRNLGLLLKITPLVIWKKNAMGAWAEFIEKFGSPVRIGKTDSTDLESVNNMQNMLQNMGVAAWGLFKTDDIIEFVESSHSDAYMVFDKMIERCNSEISKLILGQTMTIDDGSSRSQSEVHERVLDSVKQRDKVFIENVLNDQLVPLMNNLSFGLDGYKICIEGEDEFSLKEKSELDIELLKTGVFTFEPEYLKTKYGTEVKVVSKPKDGTTLKNYRNQLQKYYSE